MGKKIKYITPTVCCITPYTAEEQESRFNKEYGFNKAVSARSPVGGWEDKYIREGDGSGSPPKEVSLVKGTPHGFRHRRTGNSYSNRPARRNTRSR